MEVVNKSLLEQILEILRERITGFKLKPGTRINIDELAREFKVSKTPVRDALNKLIEKNLVEVNPRVGYYVKNLTKKEIEEICELRRVLETYALRKANFNNSDKEKLKALMQKIDQAERVYKKKGDRHLFDETDRELHGMIIQKSENRYLKKVFLQLFDLINLLQHTHQRVMSSIEEHRKLIRAILDGNYEDAQKILIDHLSKVEAGSIEVLTLMREKPLSSSASLKKVKAAK